MAKPKKKKEKSKKTDKKGPVHTPICCKKRIEDTCRLYSCLKRIRGDPPVDMSNEAKVTQHNCKPCTCLSEEKLEVEEEEPPFEPCPLDLEEDAMLEKEKDSKKKTKGKEEKKGSAKGEKSKTAISKTGKSKTDNLKEEKGEVDVSKAEKSKTKAGNNKLGKGKVGKPIPEALEPAKDALPDEPIELLDPEVSRWYNDEQIYKDIENLHNTGKCTLNNTKC